MLMQRKQMPHSKWEQKALRVAVIWQINESSQQQDAAQGQDQ